MNDDVRDFIEVNVKRQEYSTPHVPMVRVWLSHDNWKPGVSPQTWNKQKQIMDWNPHLQIPIKGT